MFESVRIKTKDEETAVMLAHDLLARYQPELAHESETEWEVRMESESDDDLPDLLSILHDRLHAPDPTIEMLINGEKYPPQHST